jgi:hypothetical protein
MLRSMLRQRLDDGIVAIEDATNPALANLTARAAAFGECPLADDRRVRGVKAPHILEGQRAVYVRD